ncbi:uncharacterized protein LOC141909724 [Tubulanus polymorphus]|uniref:uncharacterized protein LOC141909724 n=1 Tax=Tubulanus polymorphus TaxID=672921 RepID=UPI003DA4D86B
MKFHDIFPLFLFICDYLNACRGVEYDAEDHLLCRHCGHEVTKALDLTHNPSPRAIHQRNDTIINIPGILIQRFRNPHGSEFEVITATQADILKVDKAYAMDSWFPGFTWQIVVCPRCGFHLGWLFQPLYGGEQRSFIGLILDKLLHNTYADSLLITPKSYNS